MSYDKRIPERKACVLAYQLEHWAEQKPDQVAPQSV